MDTEYVIDVLNNLCSSFINDGQVHEEVIELLIDSGATVELLKKIGFTDTQIRDYAYYEAALSGRTHDEVLAELLEENR